MTVSVRAFVPENLHPHTVLAARNAKGRLTCIGGKYADGAVTATTRTTGELFVVADTIPPRIRPLFTDGADLTRAPAMRFRVGRQLLGHRLVHPVHRRQMASLRPSPDAGHADPPVRGTPGPQKPQRPAHS
ncbi:MAG: hypothetical protein ACLUQ6_00910 [Alistipes onderdonkii]